jgi:hypothetical protein
LNTILASGFQVKGSERQSGRQIGNDGWESQLFIVVAIIAVVTENLDESVFGIRNCFFQNDIIHTLLKRFKRNVDIQRDERQPCAKCP